MGRTNTGQLGHPLRLAAIKKALLPSRSLLYVPDVTRQRWKQQRWALIIAGERMPDNRQTNRQTDRQRDKETERQRVDSQDYVAPIGIANLPKETTHDRGWERRWISAVPVRSQLKDSLKWNELNWFSELKAIPKSKFQRRQNLIEWVNDKINIKFNIYLLILIIEYFHS